MNRMRIFLVALLATAVLLIAPAQAQNAAKRSITKIAGDLYRF